MKVKRGTDVFERLARAVPSFSELSGEEEVLPQQPPALDRVVRAGDVIYVRGMGGGGYGPPSERSREALLADVRDGFVSAEQAQVVYGLAGGDLADALSAGTVEANGADS
jgi:N-methylhydantoinase B/oxoprolinase/acetone carboxylase alpha subunit